MEQVNQRRRWNCPVYLAQVLEGQGAFRGDGLEVFLAGVEVVGGGL